MFTKNNRLQYQNRLINNKFVTYFGIIASILLLSSAVAFSNQDSTDLKSDTCSRLGGFAKMVMQTHQTGDSLGEFRTSLQAMQVSKSGEKAIWESRTKSMGNSVLLKRGTSPKGTMMILSGVRFGTRAPEWARFCRKGGVRGWTRQRSPATYKQTAS